jgi:hypothetical protein
LPGNGPREQFNSLSGLRDFLLSEAWLGDPDGMDKEGEQTVTGAEDSDAVEELMRYTIFSSTCCWTLWLIDTEQAHQLSG